jgi:microcystin-dependent protein
MEEYIGDIKLFAGTYCPQYFMYCDGQTLQIAQNQALFAVLGCQYGGDCTHTFCLPNLNKTPLVQGTTLKYIICTQGLFPVRPD